MKILKTYRMLQPKSEVFEAWVSESSVIAPVTSIKSDPKVGGKYILYVGEGEQQHQMTGVFKQFVRGEKLEYSWNWQGTDEVTTVTVDFQESADGSTLVTLSHQGFQSEESKSIHDQGWDSYVSGLSKLLDESK